MKSYSAGAAARVISVLAPTFCLGAAPALADKDVFGRFVGRWDIQAKTTQPQRSKMAYSETYEWTLDGKFIQGRTGRKADGSYDIAYGTYDKKADGYPFWIFSSSGSYTYLAPAKWYSGKQMMEWENPKDWDVAYHSRCYFPDADNRACNLIIKDWKGKVLLEMEWRAVRRGN
ncbi:MAG TPA: hypothetical protein VEP67_12825 [Thiobacillaceae bacterium]|nr:hypothetical protein [Thiobacillaceae bacterium]